MKDRSAIESKLARSFEEHRADTLRLIFATLLFTPVLLFIGVGAVYFLFLRASTRHISPETGGFLNHVYVLNAAFFLIYLTFYFGRSGTLKESLSWVVGATALMFGAFALSQSSSLTQQHPALFWGFYGLAFFATLTLLGYAYSPRSSFYQEWLHRPFDVMTTVDGDVDFEYGLLGMAIAIPNLLYGSLGHILGSHWLWKEPERWTWTTAAELLLALGEDDQAKGRSILQRAGAAEVELVMSLLTGMELVNLREFGLSLTVKARKYIDY